jgi:NADH-quinone oxidoreductase subunit D
VILVELERISNHLVWLGTHALDLAAMSLFLYCFRERESILDIKEMCSGQRMMTTYFRPGGLWRDIPEEFGSPCACIRMMPERIKSMSVMTGPVWMDRTILTGKYLLRMRLI